MAISSSSNLTMPEMDGYGVLETLQREGLRNKVIVVSGDIQPEAYQRVMGLGALDFIKKPAAPRPCSPCSNNTVSGVPPQAVNQAPPSG